MRINEREVATNLLMDILSNNSYNNIALRNELKNEDLTQVQKNFITQVVNGTLRNKVYIDYVINQFSNTKVSKMKPFIKALLRVSCYQIIFMDKVPDSAACNEAVKLAKQKGFQSLSGFVNGVLRNIGRSKDDINLPEKTNKSLYLSTVYSYDEWIIKYWLQQYDFETVEKMCQFNNQNPTVTICVNTLQTTVEDLIRELESLNVEVTRTEIDNCLELKNTSNIQQIKVFRRGHFFVMDKSAQLAMKVAGIKENDTVIDCCSAPGGKSFCASIYTGKGGEVLSFDIHEHKIELINNTKSRLGFHQVQADLKDASELDTALVNTADVVVCDVPCSGLGIVRKKPDIKFNKTMEDIEDLVKIQRDILNTNAQYVKVGGTLLYCTCTISKLENEDVVYEFLRQNKNFELEKLDLDQENNGMLQLIGGVNINADTFFFAKLKRKA